jgi:hypothetical protein
MVLLPKLYFIYIDLGLNKKNSNLTLLFFIIEMQAKQRKRLLIYAGIGFIITGIVSLLLIYKLMY